MKFSKELQRELEEHYMWLETVTDNYVKLLKDDGLSEFTFATFSIINSEWHMTTEPYQLHMNMEIVVHLLSVMDELEQGRGQIWLLGAP